VRAALAALLALFPVATGAACRDDVAVLRGPGGTVRFEVELADDGAERAQGLMFRERLPRFAGMLFVYERVEPVSFWMKNTLLPLDMIFLDTGGTVTHVHAKAVPGDLTPIPSQGPVRAVLEINGGLAAALGIVPGAVMQHPAFAAGPPAWPCD
jgi:uncharacterized membrane protein (UPF0127 family)